MSIETFRVITYVIAIIFLLLAGVPVAIESINSLLIWISGI